MVFEKYEMTILTHNHMTRKSTLLILAFIFSFNWVSAQQDAMYTKYMFNSLAFNPAFAGSPEYMSIRLLYREQWWGIEGAPTSQSFSIHSPVKERVGLGINVGNDKIGASSSTYANVSYAYRIPFGKGKLSIGLQAGFMNWRADWNQLKFKDPVQTDQAFENMTPNHWLPNIGSGLFYYAPKFYVGFSVPNILQNDLRKDIPENSQIWAMQYRHFYFTAGAAFQVKGPALIFKPSILIKTVGLLGNFTGDPSSATNIGAPTQFDLDLSLLFYEALWVGVSLRSAFEAKQFGGNSSFDSADIWVSYYLANGVRIGAAYDYTLTQLQSFAKGSFELMLGYDFSYKTKHINTPRYF